MEARFSLVDDATVEEDGDGGEGKVNSLSYLACRVSVSVLLSWSLAIRVAE